MYCIKEEILMESMIKAINVSAGINCMFATLQDVARTYGGNYFEPDLYFLCDGLHMTYDLSKEGLLIKLSEKMSMHNAQVHAGIFAEKTSSGMTVLEDLSEDSVRRAIKKCLENNNPVFISVSQLELDYHYRFPNASTIALHHILAVYGINTDTDEVYIGDSNILDNYGNIKCYTGWYPFSKIIKGIMGLLWFEGLPSGGVPREKVNRYAAEGLRKFVYAKPDKGFLYGQTAFRKSISELVNYAGIDSSSMETLCLDVLFWLNAHYFCVFDFLKSVLKRSELPEDETTRVEAELDDVFSKWRRFTLSITKACYGGNGSVLAKSAEEGLRIADAQEIAFIKAIKCLSKH